MEFISPDSLNNTNQDTQDPDLQNSDSDSDDGHCGQAPWFRRMKQRAKEIIEEQKE